MSLFLGVDPGVNGGFAFLNDDGSVHKIVKMPATEIEILTALVPTSGRKTYGVLEGVHASPQMGVTSAWTFGKGYGGLLMALTANEIEFQIVYPVKWQNVMGCRSGGDKNITKAKAQSLFPGVKVTHYCADALLLAEYARRVGFPKVQ